jgi:hypothetical protein
VTSSSFSFSSSSASENSKKHSFALSSDRSFLGAAAEFSEGSRECLQLHMAELIGLSIVLASVLYTLLDVDFELLARMLLPAEIDLRRSLTALSV